MNSGRKIDMSKVGILIVSLSALQFIAGCQPKKSISYKQNRIARYEMYQRLPQLISYKYTAKNITGGYYLTYIPLLFTEPDDVRQSRHRYLRAHFEIMFSKHGLVPAEYGKAEYEIKYDYHTAPIFDGTFTHTFYLDINEREKDRFTTKKAWHGEVSIRKTTSSDISLYFNNFLLTILKGFPEPQSTLRDFTESMKE
jgi:hypothetical protein